jgi:hypothetical protein
MDDTDTYARACEVQLWAGIRIFNSTMTIALFRRGLKIGEKKMSHFLQSHTESHRGNVTSLSTIAYLGAKK